jgi:LPPG:FO 2-phospho-L-lactate transferase
MKIVALAGGTGAAKLLRGLVQVIDPVGLTIIGNTGDDCVVWGLSVSPDLDTVSYTLAGLIDETKGWGVKDETFRCREAMGTFGEETYFALGDKDLALHLHRTRRLASGEPLSAVTESIRTTLGVPSRLLPMTDQRVATRVRTPDGWLSFQEFFVRERCQPEVLDVAYEGAGAAQPSPGVIEAIEAADAVIVCPSNPVSSVGPILAVRGIEDALGRTRARILAVSPIVGSRPVSGPAGKMMEAKRVEVSPSGVARLYLPWLDVLMVDETDAPLAPAVESLGVQAVARPIMMGDRAREIALARAVMGVLS